MDERRDYKVSDIPLLGRSILILEDEPLIAMKLVEAFRNAGALVFATHTLKDALPLAEHPDLSAAILDLRLHDGDADAVCERLGARQIPFVVYSGREPEPGRLRGGLFVPKPSQSDALINAVTALLR
jgi:DNA-binding response OmpR family regulator